MRSSSGPFLLIYVYHSFSGDHVCVLYICALFRITDSCLNAAVFTRISCVRDESLLEYIVENYKTEKLLGE